MNILKLLPLIISSLVLASPWTPPNGQSGDIKWYNTDSTNQILFQPQPVENTIRMFPDSLIAWGSNGIYTVSERNRFSILVDGNHQIDYMNVTYSGQYNNSGLIPVLLTTNNGSLSLFGNGHFTYFYQVPVAAQSASFDESITLTAVGTINRPSWILVDRVEYGFKVSQIPGPATACLLGFLLIRRRSQDS